MSKLLISEPPLQVLPSLAEEVGLNEAIILQQIHYWTQNSRNLEADADGTERTWVFKSHDEWTEEFPFWSRSTIRRAVKSLQEQGLIVAEQKRQHEGDNRNWYAIRREALPGSGQNEQRGSVQDDQKGWSKRPEGVVKMNKSARARKAQARDKTTTETTTESDAPAREDKDVSKNRDAPAVQVWTEVTGERPNISTLSNLKAWLTGDNAPEWNRDVFEKTIREAYLNVDRRPHKIRVGYLMDSYERRLARHKRDTKKQTTPGRAVPDAAETKRRYAQA